MAPSKFVKTLKVLIAMVVGLMALGAGVRAMNAGLSCPDWPLCFGKVIPDFHVGVYFEFIHRAYAGLVAILFAILLVWSLRSTWAPRGAKRFMIAAGCFLALQIVMGGLTVLRLLKAVIVTGHLLLATLFAGSLMLALSHFEPRIQKFQPPRALRTYATLIPFFIFAQIFLGGLVASTYAGSVCVDFPLCNGEWVPTLSGPIGIQVMHRFGAYTIAFLVLGAFGFIYKNRAQVSPQVRGLSLAMAIIILLQLCVGVANLILYIPPAMTVLHQSIAVVLFLLSLRLSFLAKR